MEPISTDNSRLTGSFTFTDSKTCADPIRVDYSYDEMMHVYYDHSGNATRLQFTGKVEITYTDLVTGATYRPNSSGPGTIDLLTGQTIMRGGNGAFFDSNGVLTATDGRVILDASGNPISIRGHVVGVCEQLGTTSN